MGNDSTDKLNRKGNLRGMSPNSQKNLGKGRVGNNHAKKGLSITGIKRDMMELPCPYAKNPAWTWAYAIAEAEMRDALDQQKARDSIKDRLEGRVPTPIALTGHGDKEIVFRVIHGS